MNNHFGMKESDVSSLSSDRSGSLYDQHFTSCGANRRVAPSCGESGADDGPINGDAPMGEEQSASVSGGSSMSAAQQNSIEEDMVHLAAASRIAARTMELTQRPY